MNKHWLVPVLAAGALLTACSHDDYDISEQESYTRQFVKNVGAFDASQDWTYAARQQVTVTMPSAGEVKVYADVDGERYIFAHYEDVSGTQTLKFDLPKTVGEVVVKACGVKRTVKVGGTVDFSGEWGLDSNASYAGGKASTRTMTTYKNEGTIGLNVTDDGWLEFDPDFVFLYSKALPNGVNNLDKYTQNFHFTANGDFTIYPIYFDSWNRNKLGIYTTKTSSSWWGATTSVDKTYLISDPKAGDEMEYALASNPDTWVNITDLLTGYNHKPSMDTLTSYAKFRSKGIKVSMKEGTEFGLYIQSLADNSSYGGNSWYSQQSLNSDNLCHAVTYTFEDAKNKYRVVAFEDSYNGGDKDLNDLVYVIVMKKGTNVPDTGDDDDKEYNWILAAEDLGNTGDFDFNDLVVSVAYTAGQQQATVKGLAAGGWLPIYLFYNDKAVGEEFHTWFNGEAPTMFNTSEDPVVSQTAEGRSYSLTVDKEFSLSAETEAADGKLGGFSVKVIRNDSTYETVARPAMSGVEAPQMLCLPATWKWPLETVNITKAYSGFKAWCADKEKNSWYESPTEGMVYTKE